MALASTRRASVSDPEHDPSGFRRR